MRYLGPIIACSVIILQISTAPLFAKTTVTSSIGFTPDGLSEIIDQFDDLVEKNGSSLADAFAMTNISGYPLGVATLGKFPAFFVGVSVGAGFGNMDYFDNEAQHEQGVFPVAGINPLLYFGIGLTKNFDLIAKLFVYSDDFYLPEFDYEGLSLSSLSFYSAGVKFRYCIFKEKNVLPGLLKFGGLNVGLGADFLYGIIGFSGTKSYPLTGIELDVAPYGIVTVDLDFDPSFWARLEWYIISLNPEILAYFNIFWIFNFYAGFGFPINFGSFDLKIEGSGDAITSTAPFPASTSLGSVSIVSTNSYEPIVFMPVLVIGLELSLWYVFLSFETNVNLINRSDVNMQLAFRIQI